MRFQLLVCLALAGIACAQTTPPSSTPPVAAPAATAGAQTAPAPEPPKVNPDDPVVTIKGFCTDSSLKGDDCKTVLTKAQFEKLTDNIQPGMAVPMRRQFANRYAQVLEMSTEGEKRGLDKTPHYEEALRLARMQILSQELTKALQTDSANISDQEMQDYYDKNKPAFEQASFVKIFVPHAKREETPAAAKDAKTATPAKAAAKTLTPEEKEKASVAAMTKEAKLLRERLVKGEDPDKLEKAAFTAAGLTGNPPPTKMEKIRRNSLPASQQSAMELKPGDISEVITEPSGNYIYKLVSKDKIPFDTAKAEIHNQLSGQRYRESMQKFQGKVDLNDAYFGASRAPGMPTVPRGAPTKDPDKD